MRSSARGSGITRSSSPCVSGGMAAAAASRLASASAARMKSGTACTPSRLACGLRSARQAKSGRPASYGASASSGSAALVSSSGLGTITPAPAPARPELEVWIGPAATRELLLRLSDVCVKERQRSAVALVLQRLACGVGAHEDRHLLQLGHEHVPAVSGDRGGRVHPRRPSSSRRSAANCVGSVRRREGQRGRSENSEHVALASDRAGLATDLSSFT
eukprot:scaffold16913_cov69-Phaeocystis_antarctica.AAC.3